MKKDINKGVSGGKIVAMGAAGIAAVGAASAGAYYLLGPKAKAHQKKVLALVNKMKKDVVGEVKKVKAVSKPIYHKTVDVIASNYAKQYKEHEKDIKAVAKQLKTEWTGVNKVVKKTVKTLKKKSK